MLQYVRLKVRLVFTEPRRDFGKQAMLLRVKLGYDRSSGDSTVTRLQVSNEDRDRLAFQLLSLILGFVGYNHTEPMESFIINPLAYRILLIDLDIWRKSAPRIQELYYKQFVTFAVKSKYHEFNSRRLIRMSMLHDAYTLQILLIVPRNCQEAARCHERRGRFRRHDISLYGRFRSPCCVQL